MPLVSHDVMCRGGGGGGSAEDVIVSEYQFIVWLIISDDVIN